MGLKRRDFFRVAGWTLAALGVSEARWLRVGDPEAIALAAERYYQALAQPTSRKLALLVGINKYQHIPALFGSLTDIELQRELLIHRFGFKEGDILTLSDQQATRQQIETAFLKHLTEQAQPDDVVVFHFSGYGRRVQLQASPEDVVNSFVPVDGIGATSENSVVNDLLEETVWLLLRSLPTERVTTVLDTSYNAASTALRGNLRIRSRPPVVQGQISTEALAFQQQLYSKNNIASQKQIPGVILAAAGSKSAAEMQWAGFSAGLFTYVLTQYLWQVTPATFQVSLGRVTGLVQQLAGKEQQPQFSSQKSQAELAAYYLKPDSSSADGVVTFVEDDGKTAHLWLAGLPPTVLEYLAVNSQLAVVNPSLKGELALQLQLRSRNGLTAKALSSNNSPGSLQVGQLVQETIRVLPRNIGLLVGLDSSLARIERVDATSAFANIPRLSLVILGEQRADYLFGRVRETKTQESVPNCYGLFSVGEELIPDTTGAVGEAVKVAVNRLAPKLPTLLAAKLWRLTANESSSRLGVKVTLEMITATEQVLIQRETLRSPTSVVTSERTLTVSGSIPTLPIGSRIQYRVHNYSTCPIYLILLGLDSSRSAIALYPMTSNPDTDVADRTLLQDVVITPGETLTVPQTSVDFEWVIRGPVGLAETQLIFSSAPFTQTLAALEATMHSQEEQKEIDTVLHPLEVAQAVLHDLQNAGTLITETINPTTDTYTLNVNAWASFSFIYQIVCDSSSIIRGDSKLHEST